MAKKNNRAVNEANVLFTSESEPTAASSSRIDQVPRVAAGSSAKEPGFWASLGHGERIAVVAVCLLLVVGAIGAGLGNKITSVFVSKDSTSSSQVSSSNESSLAVSNPPAPLPTPSPTPQLSKEYIYAGSRMLAVEDANASAAPPADLAVWRPSTGYWYVLGGQGSQQTAFQWGGTDDEAVPGDYDGDGKTDFSVFRHTNGTWYTSTSSSGGANYTATAFGLGSDKPVAADYDGDGRTDIGVFRPSTGHWYLQCSTQGYKDIYFGQSGDDPAPADYDGDGKADVALWRGSAYTLYVKRSSDNQTQLQTIYNGAVPGDKPVSADYDGDGKADFAVRHGGDWLIRYSTSSYANATDVTIISWQVGDYSVPNDYDGDGKVDIAVWRSSDGHWLIRQSASLSQNNGLRDVQWGQGGDTPVSAFYRR